MRRKWIKLYVEQILRGTMMSELPGIQKWIWIGFLLLAGDSSESGKIFLRKKDQNTYKGYSDQTLAELLDVEYDDLIDAKEKMIKFGKIEVNELNAIFIKNWKKYQSEYERKKPYRSDKKRCDKSDKKSDKKNYDKSDALDRERDRERDKEKETNNRKKSSRKFSNADLETAKLLEKKIKERLPKYRIKGLSYLEDWANEFRIMEEKKEASIKEIKAIIFWVFDKSDFWYKNILSASTLREKFGRLWEEAKKDSGKGKYVLDTNW